MQWTSEMMPLLSVQFTSFKLLLAVPVKTIPPAVTPLGPTCMSRSQAKTLRRMWFTSPLLFPGSIGDLTQRLLLTRSMDLVRTSGINGGGPSGNLRVKTTLIWTPGEIMKYRVAKHGPSSCG